MVQSITIKRPDDWHLHVRDGEILKTVLPFTSAHFGRAIIMPNLTPPVMTIEQALSYKQRICDAVPTDHQFEPLMVCYLSNNVVPEELERGFLQGVFTAAKLYPAHATTNSSFGLATIRDGYHFFERMQKIGMPLLIHGEVTDKQVDIFDREAVFIDSVLKQLRKDFPELKIVLEHITTQEAAEFVCESDLFTAATITPQHLLLNRNDMLVGGIRPHLYCLPILKRERHQHALRNAVAKGHPRIFLGTDSAPHLKHLKEHACGCAGVFNAAAALAVYAQVFEELNALPHFEAFCSENGPNFYNLPINQDTLTLVKQPNLQPDSISLNVQSDEQLIPFMAGETLEWAVLP